MGDAWTDESGFLPVGYLTFPEEEFVAQIIPRVTDGEQQLRPGSIVGTEADPTYIQNTIVPPDAGKYQPAAFGCSWSDWIANGCIDFSGGEVNPESNAVPNVQPDAGRSTVGDYLSSDIGQFVALGIVSALIFGALTL